MSRLISTASKDDWCRLGEQSAVRQRWRHPYTRSGLMDLCKVVFAWELPTVWGYDGHVSVEAMTGLCRAPRLEHIPTGSLPGTGPDRRTRPAVWGMRVCTTAAKQGCGGREFFQNILWSSGSAAQHNLVVDPPTIKLCAFTGLIDCFLFTG